jgi:DNA modification methylase
LNFPVEALFEGTDVKSVCPSFLSPHPVNEEIYGVVTNTDLEENIKRVGILEPLVALKDGTVISGHRRLEVAKRLGLEKIPVRYLELDDIDQELFLVSFNRYRTKGVTELLKEIEVLYKHYGRNQGKRTDLTSVNVDRGKTTREKVAEMVGISTGNISKLLKIKERMPLLLPEIDGGKLSINQAYLWCNRKARNDNAINEKEGITFNGVSTSDYQLIKGDSLHRLRGLENESVSLCFTSPPYYQFKRFGKQQVLGHEEQIKSFVSGLNDIFREVFRVLEDGGTFLLNMDEPFINKQLLGTTERMVVALLDQGFVLRQKIIWQKGHKLQGSLKGGYQHVYEPIYLFTKGTSMKFNTDKIRKVKEHVELKPTYFDYGNSKCHAFLPDELEPKPHDIIEVGPMREKLAKKFGVDFQHPAQFPPELVEPFVIAGTSVGDVVLDPFNGVGNTGVAALRNNRRYIGIDLNDKFLDLSEKRFRALT